MDDISALRECWSEVEPPSRGAQDRARAALLARISQSGTAAASARTRTSTAARRRLLPTWAWRTGVATMAAAALAVSFVVTMGPAGNVGNQASGRPGSSSTSAANGPAGQTIELAAVYAAAQPFTQPRPDQWAYIELKIATPDSGHPGTMSQTLRKSWYRIDGTQIAVPNSSGRIDITTHPEGKGRVGPKPALNPHDYPTLAAMPTDPQTLLTFLRAGLEPVTDPNLDRSGSLFSLIGYILRENVLPPPVTAALLRAAALIPGVTQAPETVTLDGHQAIAVGRVDGPAREDILLDSVTKEFLGSRSVAVEDEPLAASQPAGQPKQTIPDPAAKTGDVQYIITRGNCTIVNAPGLTS